MWPIWFNHQGRHVSAFMDLAKHNVQSLGLATPGGARQIRRAGQWPRNTRYQADATPYLDRTCTGRIAPALPGALIQSPRRRWRGAAGVGPGHCKPSAPTFSKLKAFMRKIAARTLAGLIRALEACAKIFKPAERKNYVAVRGDYLPFPETHHSQWQCPGVSHTHSPP